jgi:hypothetical protein
MKRSTKIAWENCLKHTVKIKKGIRHNEFGVVWLAMVVKVEYG